MSWMTSLLSIHFLNVGDYNYLMHFTIMGGFALDDTLWDIG